MHYMTFGTVCFFATSLVLPVGKCVPSPVHTQHHVYDFDFEFHQPGAHHREPRKTGRGISLDTWACETVTSLPDDIRAEFPLHEFYHKYTHAYGIPIISSNVSQDEALVRACYTVRFLLADRKDLRDAMFDHYGRVGVIALTERTTEIPEHSHLDPVLDDRARGLGGIPSIPITTDGEENLLCNFRKDRWFEEDVMIHEFAHAVHLISMNWVNSSFEPDLENVYNMAIADNLWTNTYAITTFTEYFAEGVQSFFDVNTCRGFQDNVHNEICTRDLLMGYDRRLYDLIVVVFPCMNVVVGRCETDQNHAANQVLRMNCDELMATTTVDATTYRATTENTTENPTESTTERTTESTPGIQVRVFRITIVIVRYQSNHAVFTNDLHNSTSAWFLTHQHGIENLLRQAFGVLPGFRDTIVLFYFNGSIGVEASVTYDANSAVTQSNIKNILSSGTPFVGSEYEVDLQHTKLREEVCVDGFCQNGGSCKPSIDTFLSSCKCLPGFAGDMCEIRTVTGTMTTDQPPRQSNTATIVICLIATVLILICIAILIKYLIARKKRVVLESANGVELK